MGAGNIPTRNSLAPLLPYTNGDTTNYRSITVTPPLRKVSDFVLECRLTTWTEEHGLRAATLAGIRPHQRTSDQHYALHTRQDKYCRGSGLLFYGLPQSLLTLCHGMYCGHGSVSLVLGAASCLAYRPCTEKTSAVKIAEGLSTLCRCQQGVQQGSPLSPIFLVSLLTLWNASCRAPPAA